MSEAIEKFKSAVANIGYEPLKVLAIPLQAAILDLDERLAALEGQLKKSDSHKDKHHD
jgi:hypothetical protein